MKKLHLILIGLLFLSTMAKAQSADEQELRRLETQWTDLLDKGDTTSLLKIWSPEYVVNNPNGKIVTAQEIISIMKSGFKFPAVKRIIEKITFNQNIAIVMGKELQQPSNKTENQNEWIPRRFTNVWIKTNNTWQLAARQSLEVPKK